MNSRVPAVAVVPWGGDRQWRGALWHRGVGWNRDLHRRGNLRLRHWLFLLDSCRGHRRVAYGLTCIGYSSPLARCSYKNSTSIAVGR